MIKLSPSILAADFTILGRQIAEADEAGVPYIHVDVMDGIFVPSISFGMPVIASIRKATDKIFDVHLMIAEPERYVEEFKECGADIITFHIEAAEDSGAMISRIHAMGIKAGIAIRPATPVEEVFPYLAQVDMVLVMSVNPGFGGQEFIPETLERIAKIRKYIENHGLATDIQVDGGLYQENVGAVIQAGANVIVAGSAVFYGNIRQNIEHFQKIFAENKNI